MPELGSHRARMTAWPESTALHSGAAQLLGEREICSVYRYCDKDTCNTFEN